MNRVGNEPWGQMLRRHTDNIDWTMNSDKLMDGIVDRMALDSEYANNYEYQRNGKVSKNSSDTRNLPQADGWVGVRSLARLTGANRRLKLYVEVVDEDDSLHTITASFAVVGGSEEYTLIVEDIRSTGKLKSEHIQSSMNTKFRYGHTRIPTYLDTVIPIS